MKVLATLIIIFFLFACQKNRIELKDHMEFVGNYEWYHSYSTYSNSYESYQSITDQYGIRIRKNGKVEHYKNGSISQKGYVIQVEDSMILVQLEDESIQTMILDGTDLIVKYYPFGYYNKFKKHD